MMSNNEMFCACTCMRDFESLQNSEEFVTTWNQKEEESQLKIKNHANNRKEVYYVNL